VVGLFDGDAPDGTEEVFCLRQGFLDPGEKAKRLPPPNRKPLKSGFGYRPESLGAQFSGTAFGTNPLRTYWKCSAKHLLINTTHTEPKQNLVNAFKVVQEVLFGGGLR
jgi:hypothetical protein